jgi:hypothetical protein
MPALTAVVALMVVAAGCVGDGAEATSALDLEGLSDCPNPLVIQTDWFPRPEQGALYNLTDGEGSIDPETGRFTGPLAADTTITIEIRSGGPFLGGDPVIIAMAEDDDIFLGLVSTDEAIGNYQRRPSTAVVAPLDVNPQVLMWDPATYEVTQWTDIKKTGAAVRHVAGATYAEYLLESGLVLADQLDDSYKGDPADFISARGEVILEGRVTREPYLYEQVLEDWGKPVDYLLVHDAGYELYPGAVTVLDERLDNQARSCLRSFVPLVQRSIVGFQRDPSIAIAVINQAVVDLDVAATLTEDAAREAVIQMGLLGVVGNGENQAVGDFDLERIDELIAVIMEDVESVPVPLDLDAEDLVTNEFINDDVGL